LHFALGLVLEVGKSAMLCLSLSVTSRSSFFLVSSSALTGSSSVLVSFSALGSSAFFASDAGASEYILMPDILCDTAGVNCWEMKAERWSLAGAAEDCLAAA